MDRKHRPCLKVSKLSNIALYILVPGLTLLCSWLFMRPYSVDQYCYKNFAEGGALYCRPYCLKGFFSLPWMHTCLPYLTCKDIESKEFEIKEPLGHGAVKAVHRAEWKGHVVVINNLINPAYKDDFLHGLKMLMRFQPSHHVTQLIGYCKNTFVTEYHAFGSADNIEKILNQDKYKHYNNVDTRFKLCQVYAQLVAFLHNSPFGTRVMCDSNDLQKTLNQFLITQDLKLVVNDLDALPLVNHSAGVLIKCGYRQIHGDFVAPEQLWPHKEEFDYSKMPAYDEKTDIYKIPSVCDNFLGDLQTSEMLRFHLFMLHQKCKAEDPTARPTAKEVVQEYQKIWDEFLN